MILGAGVGDSHDRSFTNFGEETDIGRRARMLDEALDVITGLWSGTKFSYLGEHYQVKEATLLPRPVQRPRIPVWVGGGWPRKKTVERAARWDGACFYKVLANGQHAMMTPADLRELKASLARLRPARARFDIVVGGVTPANRLGRGHAHVLPLAEAGATWWAEFGSPDSRVLRRRILAGPPG